VNYERSKKGARFFETQCSALYPKKHDLIRLCEMENLCVLMCCRCL